MKGLGDSLFGGGGGGAGSTNAAQPKRQNDVLAPQPVAAPAASSSAGPGQAGAVDYESVLRKFYEKHNPGKVGEIAKHLQKYRVSAIPLLFVSYCFIEFVVRLSPSLSLPLRVDG